MSGFIEFVMSNIITIIITSISLLASIFTIIEWVRGHKKSIIGIIAFYLVVLAYLLFSYFKSPAQKITPQLTAIRDSYGYVTSFEIACVVPDGSTMTSWSIVYQAEGGEPFTNTFDYETFVGQCVVKKRNGFSLYDKKWSVYGYVTIDGIDYSSSTLSVSDPESPQEPDWDIENQNQYIREPHVVLTSHDTYEFQLYQDSTYQILTKVPNDNSVFCSFEATALSTEEGIKAEGVTVDNTGLIHVSNSAHGTTEITIDFSNRGTKTIYVVVVDSNGEFTE